MAEFLSSLVFILFLLLMCVLISIPGVLLYWVLKFKKIKNEIPEEVKQIVEDEKFKKEKRTEESRRRYNGKGNYRRETGIDRGSSEESLSRSSRVEGHRNLSLQEAPPLPTISPSDDREERDTKKDWPSFD